VSAPSLQSAYLNIKRWHRHITITGGAGGGDGEGYINFESGGIAATINEDGGELSLKFSGDASGDTLDGLRRWALNYRRMHNFCRDIFREMGAL